MFFICDILTCVLLEFEAMREILYQEEIELTMVTYDQFMEAAEKHPDLFERLKEEHRLKGRNSIDYALQRIKQQLTSVAVCNEAETFRTPTPAGCIFFMLMFENEATYHAPCIEAYFVFFIACFCSVAYNVIL